MGKVALQMYLSLDGVMEAPENWEGPFWSDELEQYALEQVLAADALLLGRTTYEIFASSWPSRSGDAFSDRMNNMPKFVVSKTLKAPEWNASVIDGDAVEEVSKLKEQSGQDLMIYASGELVRPLMQHGLIDDLRFWIFPVVLGSGKRLFREETTTTLELINTETFATGAVALRYQPKPAS
jgi:dihydrofolate reductase